MEPLTPAVLAGKAFGIAFFSYVLPHVILKPNWQSLLSFFGGTKGLVIWGSFSMHVLVYVLVNAFYLALYTLRLPFFEQFKVVPKPWPWTGPEGWGPHRAKLGKVLLLWLFNNVIVGLPVTLVLYTGKESDGSLSTFPTVSTMLWQLFVCLFIEDVLFTTTHRLLHSKQLYFIHKLHHSYSLTVSWAAEYAHPLEFLLGNGIPFIAGLKLLKAHPAMQLVWMALRIASTLEGHSGYCFPASPLRLWPSSGMDHDAHHSMNTGNYGSSFGIWDVVFGSKIPALAVIEAGLRRAPEAPAGAAEKEKEKKGN